ncbi:MAG: bifunctional 5,10-methylenetetrahydrofolate dehydrogenase/5,10-methenyltetrahydrofolate cyclohydrolase [Elusimicrobia bacterium]|nr:bifunctional 5,10-methylenetetrahydrofolate dehydrogenase/5,10-methenyltetrahydrofolate cyclohydrolase [Elusimicrobiota bacterium]
MAAKILDGKKISLEIIEELKKKSAGLAARLKRPPTLATVLVGDDPASQIYVRNKIQACREVGIQPVECRHPSSFAFQNLSQLLEQLSSDPRIDGILLQLPLPTGFPTESLLEKISPEKDVDGLTSENLGKFFSLRSLSKLPEAPVFVPCTPLGIWTLLKRTGVALPGARATVVGRSNIVGKPVALLLTLSDATVTLCHSKTVDLPNITSQADILIAATGRPRSITGEMVQSGAVVIDVGIHRDGSGSLCGDVAESVREKASWITPVPGGVGPMTVTMLLSNTLLAAQRRLGS